MSEPLEPQRKPLLVDIGVMAADEERSIGALLGRLSSLRFPTVQINSIVVVSASTDRTHEIVEERAARDSRIRLIKEPSRRGKATAINLFLETVSSPVVMLIGADTMPAAHAVEALALPFLDPDVGMTGARPVPVNRGRTFMDFAAHFLWQAHHLLALRNPKCGEMVAFRPVFDSIPADTIVDEPEIMARIGERGLGILYTPAALVYNWGPSTVAEFLMRRRSITAGYLQQTARGRKMHQIPLGVKISMGAALARWLLARRRPVELAWGPYAVFLELVSRTLGRWDFLQARRGRRTGLHVWKIAATTKRGQWDALPPEPETD